MSEKIQVRAGWWRQRCGDVVRVWSRDSERYPWRSRFDTYTEQGGVYYDCVASADLVEYLGETGPTLRPPAQLEPVLSICEAIPDDRRELIRRFAVALVASRANVAAPLLWTAAKELADAEPEVTDAEGCGGGT